tara:strand:+ start:65 stop:607 length:543 start_codon:yes stop_codon:yes gene_type:complete
MTETNDKEDKQAEATETELDESNLEEKELSETELLQKKIEESHDSLLRAKAEVENIKKRSQKEVENAYKYSIESVLQEIIPIYDSLSLSCSLTDKKMSKEQLEEGNKLLLSMFQQLFEKNNIQEINPKDESFNPEFHQAVSTIKDSKQKNDTISEVVQKGYVLNDRVIKPALVVVVKNKD